MDIEGQGKLEFSHATLLDVWLNGNRDGTAIKSWVLEQMSGYKISNEKVNEISLKLSCVQRYIKMNLKKCSRNIRTFKKRHSNWLSSSITIILESQEETLKTRRGESVKEMGRPKLPYNEAGQRLKRKLASDLADTNANCTSLLMNTAAVSAKETIECATAYVLKNAMLTSNGPSEVKKKLFASEPIPLSPSEALEFMLENSLSKAQYNSMRNLNIKQNSNIYPSYKKIQEAKLQLRPAEIT